MTQVAMWRLYLLRAFYLLILVGLAIQMWPLLLHHRADWPVMNSVVVCMLTALSLLAGLGLRYPLQMLPLLIFELLWKSIWLLVIALPLWRAGSITPDTMDTVVACIGGVILTPIAIPWDYVWANYVKKPGDPWKARPAA